MPIGTVRVRGLTVAEVTEIKKLSRNEPAQLLMQTIALGMVEPQMTAERDRKQADRIAVKNLRSPDSI